MRSLSGSTTVPCWLQLINSGTADDVIYTCRPVPKRPFGRRRDAGNGNAAVAERPMATFGKTVFAIRRLNAYQVAEGSRHDTSHTRCPIHGGSTMGHRRILSAPSVRRRLNLAIDNSLATSLQWPTDHCPNATSDLGRYGQRQREFGLPGDQIAPNARIHNRSYGAHLVGQPADTEKTEISLASDSMARGGGLTTSGHRENFADWNGGRRLN